MKADFVRNEILKTMRERRIAPEEAARYLAAGFGRDYEDFEPGLELIRREAATNDLLDGPTGVVEQIQEEAKLAPWYVSASEGVDLCWAGLRNKLEVSGMADAVPDIDVASTKVVAHLANPNVRGLAKRGLVLGYVQSGKTANFTSVMAKAADAGYCLFIVLSGLHNNLRQQTQVRLDNDLMDEDWHPLTSADADFSNSTPGTALLKKRMKSLAVVKKNTTRLQALRDWLRDIPMETRRKVPILLLDDEADQATPNSAKAEEERSRINELVRQIWREIPTGTYLGYTATPFANVFMDPADEEELYPADFIIDLPRPESYFGAERIFGREPLHDDDDPDSGLDMVRNIPESEADLLKPPSRLADRESFDPELPESLKEAVRWFVLAAAVRRYRGQIAKHSSMLVHTTHFVDPHFALKRRVEAYLEELLRGWGEGERGGLRRTYADEADRVTEVGPKVPPAWEALEDEVERVLEEARVVVDNGRSDDRLDYARRDPRGNVIPETVIAIGGGTLSRGLTLEGLIVSYFTRTSNTYDTLLQMGRWFGFRPGYEDLPRMWLQKSLAQEFRFLALIEEEIRGDIRDMALMRQTPRQLGVRVRSHPGRLEIVARNKMRHAKKVSLSYAGQRLQTISFEETDTEVIQRNLMAARALVAEASTNRAVRRHVRGARWQIDDVPSQVVTRFLDSYSFGGVSGALNANDMIGWIEQAVPDRRWNIVVAGSTAQHLNASGDPLDLGSVDLGLGEAVPTVNRAPLRESAVGQANIKALLSTADWFADLDPDQVAACVDPETRPKEVRRQLAGGRGLIILMPIGRNSIPLTPRSVTSRRNMQAPDHLVGVGIIFPSVTEGSRASSNYYSVLPDWEPEPYEEDEMPEDREPDYVSAEV